VDTNNHPIMKDLARVKSYMNRAKEATDPKKGEFPILQFNNNRNDTNFSKKQKSTQELLSVLLKLL